MTAFQWFAAAGMPALIVLLAFIVLKWFQWDLDRRDAREREKLHPGE